MVVVVVAMAALERSPTVGGDGRCGWRCIAFPKRAAMDENAVAVVAAFMAALEPFSTVGGDGLCSAALPKRASVEEKAATSALVAAPLEVAATSAVVALLKAAFSAAFSAAARTNRFFRPNFPFLSPLFGSRMNLLEERLKFAFC